LHAQILTTNTFSNSTNYHSYHWPDKKYTKSLTV
jgi:hypothetical protein